MSRKKATKTAPLTDDTHKYLKWLQAILYNRYNIDMQIRDILDHIVKNDDIKDAEKVARDIAGIDVEKGDIIIIKNGKI